MNNHAHPHNSADTHGSLRLLPSVASDPDVPTPDEVALYVRQTGELVDMVAAAMTSERHRHSAAMRSLRAVEAALAEQATQLAALAARLGGDHR